MSLSRRQHQIATCVSRGLSDKEIANEAAISVHTVRFHTKNLYRKTRTRSKLELAVWFISSRMA